MRSRGVISPMSPISPISPMGLMGHMGPRPILLSYQLPITLWPAISEELPGVTHFTDHVEIQVGNHERVLIARRLLDDLTARITEVTLPVEFTDVPGHFVADAIDGADEVTIGHRMRGLF